MKKWICFYSILLSFSSFASIKVCLIGDTGTASEGQYAVAKALENENCNQVRILGDVIYPDGLKSVNDPLLGKLFLHPYRGLLKTTNIHIALGNHDYREAEEVWLEIANIYDSVVFPYFFYADRLEDVCFATLDSMTIIKYPKSARTAEQLRWIRDLSFRKASVCKYKIALAHHPYISSGKHGAAPKIYKSFLDQYVIGKFSAYIAGHDHILTDEGTARGTRLLISGAGGKLREVEGDPAGGYGASKYGFLTLEKVNQNLIYQFKVVDKNGNAKIEHRGKLQPTN